VIFLVRLSLGNGGNPSQSPVFSSTEPCADGSGDVRSLSRASGLAGFAWPTSSSGQKIQDPPLKERFLPSLISGDVVSFPFGGQARLCSSLALLPGQAQFSPPFFSGAGFFRQAAPLSRTHLRDERRISRKGTSSLFASRFPLLRNPCLIRR